MSQNSYVLNGISQLKDIDQFMIASKEITLNLDKMKQLLLNDIKHSRTCESPNLKSAIIMTRSIFEVLSKKSLLLKDSVKLFTCNMQTLEVF